MAKAMNKEKVETKEDKIGLKEGILAWLPYILLCGLILIASPLVPSINSFLAKASSNIHIYTGDATNAGKSAPKYLAINT